MAISSIFTNILIKDPEKIDLFIDALESSEEAVKNRPITEGSNISILRDADSTRKFMAKMIENKYLA